MSLSVVALVVVLIFIMLGYQFNRNDGKIEQGGLVQFDSKPSGATVDVDGASLGSPTASKATLTAGQHFVSMQRKGYESWQKSVLVVPGSVLWLNYAHLIPNDLKPENVAEFGALSSSIASPNDKWMAAQEDPAVPRIQLADISGDSVKMTALDLPSGSYTHPAAGKIQSFSLETWDPDSRYILVKHAFDDTQTEWLVVDTQDAGRTKNVTKLLDVQASKLLFDGGNSAILYAQIGHDLRKIDLNAATLSRPLVTNVADFSLYDTSTLVYSTLLDPETKNRTVGYYKDGADKPQIIRTYEDDGQAPLKAAVGKYFSDIYVVIAYGNTLEVLKGDLPTDDNPTKSTLKSVKTIDIGANGAQYLTIRTEGRFIVVQNGPTYTTYDTELQKTTTTTLKGSTDVTKEIGWLDNYTLWSDRDGMLRLYEFDGANQHDIMPVVSGQAASLSPNAKYLYGFIKGSDGSYHLQRVRLILP